MLPQDLAKQKQLRAASTQRRERFSTWLGPNHGESSVAWTPSSGLSQTTIQRTLANPRALVPSDIVQLQRTVGNQAVQGMLNPGPQPTVQRTTARQPLIQRKWGKKHGTSGGKNKPNKDDQDGAPQSRYLEDGGTGRWRKETGLGTSGYISAIDQDLWLYRQYKSKNRGNAEEQAELLLRLQRSIANSRYQSGLNKSTSTFQKRKAATTNLKAEVDRELQTNATRLVASASQGDRVKELMRIGFSKSLLRDINQGDLNLLYEAHVFLSYKQMGSAQAAFDRLNPVRRDDYGKLKYDQSNRYIERTRSDLHIAQQMVVTHHHAAIGGAYGASFTQTPMDQAKLQEVKKKYLGNKDFLGAGNVNTVKNNGAKPLKDLVKDHRDLSKQELEAIRIYTSDVYKRLNATLHDFRVGNPQEQAGFEGYASINQLLASGLSKLPSYAGPPVVRGDYEAGGLLNTLRPGTIYQAPTVISSTKKFVPPWGNIYWRIQVASNSRGKDVQHLSVATNEAEVLFQAGTKFKIIDVIKRVGDPFTDVMSDGESREDWVRRLYKSEGKKKISDSIVTYLDRTMSTCGSLILAQEF